jgi:hypothetical protein
MRDKSCQNELPKQIALTDWTKKPSEKAVQLLAQIGTWQMADGFFAIDVAGVMANVPCKLASSLDTAGEMLAEMDDQIIKILDQEYVIELYKIDVRSEIPSYIASCRDENTSIEQYRGEGPWPLSALLNLIQNYAKIKPIVGSKRAD